MNNVQTLGNDEKGSAIAAEIENTEQITSVTGSPIVTPSWAMMGSSMIPATVCETNVATDAQNIIIKVSEPQGAVRGSASVTMFAKNVNKPLLVTAHPSTLPPPINISKCHERQLKSTCRRQSRK